MGTWKKAIETVKAAKKDVERPKDEVAAKREQKKEQGK
jgi:hypothetical protein